MLKIVCQLLPNRANKSYFCNDIVNFGDEAV